MKRFQRPINEYTGSEQLLYRDKYQQDSNSVPKIAISSAKVDGDFNYLVDAVNTLDEDIKSVVHTGIANQTIEEKHLAANTVSETKLQNEAVSSRSVQPGAITNAKVADLAITTPKLANNSVTKDKMSTASVGTDELEDKSITRDKLADDAISDSVPVGTIAHFSINALPTGWILCDGATVSKNTYPQLVRFLTSTDTILSADLPDLNTDPDAKTKYAIKAFSDTVELANLDIAGLTQDVANNSAVINDLKLLGEETVLWEGDAINGEITLSDDIFNYKEVIFLSRTAGGATDKVENRYKTSNIALGDLIFTVLQVPVQYASIRVSSSAKLSIVDSAGLWVNKIVGVK